MTSTPITDLIAFTIDCSDASTLATFYADLMGGEVTGVYPEYGYAQAAAGGATLNFQGVENYHRPQWPTQEHPQQYHLDLRVTDLDDATKHAESVGASVAEFQPAEDAFRVMIDPDGHPFCLCPPQS